MPGVLFILLCHLVVIFCDPNVVPKIVCGLCCCMGDQCLFLREIQLDRFQKIFDLLFDLFCFCARSSKSQKEIVGIPAVSKRTLIRIVWVTTRKLASVFLQLLCKILFTLLSSVTYVFIDP